MKLYLLILVFAGLTAFCVNGQIITIAQNLNKPWSVATDGTDVYWVEGELADGAVKKNSINGGVITTLASGLAEPRAIGVDAAFVYWIERNGGSNGTLNKISKNGGAVILLADSLLNAQNFLALNDKNIYWGDGQPGGGGVINRIYKDDPAGTIITLVSGLINMTTAIAADNDFVYFYDVQNNIKTVPAMGGAVTIIGNGEVSSLYMSGNNIFWTEYDNGIIKKMPKTGGAITTITSDANRPANLVVYNNYVYWIEFTNPGRVAKVPVTGGATTVIANEANTIGIATDSTNIYWAVSVYLNQGKIQKLGIATETELYESGCADNISIFPNPANNSFSLSFTATNTSIYKLAVYSSLGTLIYTETVEIIAGENVKEIELENVQSGIYFFQLKSENETLVKKLMIEK